MIRQKLITKVTAITNISSIYKSLSTPIILLLIVLSFHKIMSHFWVLNSNYSFISFYILKLTITLAVIKRSKITDNQK